MCEIGGLYEIVWEDVLSGGSLWTDLSEIKKEVKDTKMLFKSVGYVVHITKGRIIIAATLDYGGEMVDATIGHWIAIPHVLIREIEKLN